MIEFDRITFDSNVMGKGLHQGNASHGFRAESFGCDFFITGDDKLRKKGRK